MTDENAADTPQEFDPSRGESEAIAEAILDDPPPIEERGLPVSSARFPPILEEAPGMEEDSRNLDLLMDVTVPITAEIGHNSLPLSEVLRLGPGSVIELDKSADEPVEILVNGKLLATAEVVVVGDRFGVRILDVVERGEV